MIDYDIVEAGRLPAEAGISAITTAELAAGPHATDDPDERARLQERLQWAVATFDAQPFDGEAARAYGRVVAAVRTAGRRERSRPGRQMIGSMCSGALELAALGLLDGAEAMTYPTATTELEAFGVTVVEEPFVANGNGATAAGCLAAQHLVGWVVERLLAATSCCGRFSRSAAASSRPMPMRFAPSTPLRSPARSRPGP